jgi:hypothetical protein
MRSIGNICTGDDKGVDLVIMSGYLEPLLQILESSERKIIEKKEAAWTLSNIAAGTHA